MSVEQIATSLLKLPPAERAAFANWFYEHEDELPGNDDGEIHPEVQSEIRRRRAEALAHPEWLGPWEGTTERLRGNWMKFAVRKFRPAEADVLKAAVW